MNTNLLTPHLHLRCHFQSPKTPKPIPKTPQPIPARDRVIDFGKHKGKPLGALPSTYLKWVSKTLRARNTEHWAHLADQVLKDPIYQDRIEWEFAQNVLHGTNRNTLSGGSVAEILQISDRFGWDNDDKDAWKRVDFGLLGTSKSGRIPRKRVKESDNDKVPTQKKENVQENERKMVHNPFPGREGLLRDVLRGRRFL